MDWKMAGLAIVIALGLWLVSNPAQTAPLIVPQYEIYDMDGIESTRILLSCDEMVVMRDLTRQEGQLREADAYSCGTNRDGICLPYYIQNAVLHELDNYLKAAIQDNCKES